MKRPSKLQTHQLEVLQYVANVPAGKVTTYGRIAKDLFLPTPRLVGKILHTNPDGSKYPCHRVVFSDGSLAPAYAFGGAEVQRKKLLEEGVVFKKNKVDLEKCCF